ncbi:MAG: tetratricopeptide repeat protein [Planctomycetes bacterium]|nr:tetratricopeptide repeat protein [Planctomycetota bacterium]
MMIPSSSAADRRPILIAAGVAVLALVAAGPSIDGAFLSGDDKHLLLNHVLVNHPSLTNAGQLLTLEAHRDLYQPVPLLTFAAEFKVIRWLSWPIGVNGAGAGVALFHVTNILLHAFNAVLVFWLFRRLQGKLLIAALVAGLFAVHPLSVESYAWLNGRMTLLSTLFSLISLVAMDIWLERGRRTVAVIAMIAVVLAMCSKVRLGLPVLMLLWPMARGKRPPMQWWWTWGISLAVTVGFAGLNAWMSRSAGMFAGGTELTGSRMARTIIALGWYFRCYVWPTGLSPHYPTDAHVDFSHELVPMALVAVMVTIASVLVFARWSRVGLLGLAWFLATIASTLPLVPARNLMAADRYVYLPVIGLHWIVATVIALVLARLARKRALRAGLVAGLAVAGVALLAISWSGSSFYHDDLARAQRIADRYPDVPGMWVQVAWAHYDRGQYEQVIDTASQDVERGDALSRGSAYQVIGMAQHRLGRVGSGIDSLEYAVELSPDDAKAHTRLGRGLEAAGRDTEAAEHYRRAVVLAPNYNPAVLSLAAHYRDAGDAQNAIHYYRCALDNNAFDPTAAMGIAVLDMAAGRYDQAQARLKRLLSWMPTHAEARTNLGVCLARTGRPDDAMAQYRRVLDSTPGAPTAAANLSLLLSAKGAGSEAIGILQDALAQYPAELTLLIAYHDVCIEQGQPNRAIPMWQRASESRPAAATLSAWWAWSAAISGDSSTVRSALDRAGSGLPTRDSAAGRLIDMAEAWLRLDEGDPALAIGVIDRFVGDPPTAPPDTLMRLRRGLRLYGSAHPDRPWPYYLMAHLLLSQGDGDGLIALDLFDQLCEDPVCKERSDRLRATLATEN